MFQMEKIAESLKRHRKKQGLTQGELAQKLFVSTQSVSKWERGEALPDIAHLCRLAEIFRVSVDVLLGNYMPSEKTLIGVDGGGTATEFILVNQKGMILKRVLLAGINPNIYGLEKICEILKEGLDLLLQMDTRVMGVFIGGSGFAVGGGKIVESVLRAAYPELLIRCDSNIRSVFACSSDPEHCIAAISSTGSVAFANRAGELIRTGGSGYLVDRAGSGYDMGRDAIAAALDEEDEVGPATAMTPMIQKRLKGEVREHIQDFYKQDPSFIASFAPIVEAACEKGDAVALGILEKNCRRLADLIHAAARKSSGAGTVILAGSMLAKGTLFRQKLLSLLDPSLKPEDLIYPQIWGALLQCARLCGMTPPDAELFVSQYRLYEAD